MKKHVMVMGILMGMFFHAFSQDYPLRVWKFKPGEKAYPNAGQFLLQSYHLSAPYSTALLGHQSKEKNGKQVYRLQQTYGNVPVDRAVALVHVKNNQVERIIANWPEAPIRIAATPSVTTEKAIATALKTVGNGASLYKNAKGEDARLLVWRSAGQWFLVYEIMVAVETPVDFRRVLINAHTGVVLHNESQGHSCCTPATAATNYSGTQSMVTDNHSAGNYRLRACLGAGGAGDCVAPVGNYRTVKNNSLVDFTHTSTSWTGFTANTADRCALDVHWGTQAVFDYYLNHCPMTENIFYGDEVINIVTSAFQNAYYFNGTNRFGYGVHPITGKFMTSLDIVAHELTHYVTAHNSGMVYENESGAINEALSDIFAMAVEDHYGMLDWLIGDDFGTLRSFEHPNDYKQADTYGGFWWVDGTTDNGGVHFNSGVINHWFFLLVNGGTGSNDLGDAFSINGIGIDKAIELVSLLQSSYLTSTTDMHEMRELALIAAGELWHYCSEEYIAVVDAFYAVGIGEPFSAHTPIDETWETDITSCNARLHWEDVGAQQYLIHISPPDNTGEEYYHSLINEVMVHDLDPNTHYEWTVFARCEDYMIATDHADDFVTGRECPNLTDLTVSDITTCSAALLWAYNSAWQFRIYYQAQGSSITQMVDVTGSPGVLSGLLPNTTYDVRVIPMCGDSCRGAGEGIQFTTLGCDLVHLTVDNNPCYFSMNWHVVEGQSYVINMFYIDPTWPFPLEHPIHTDFLGSYTFQHEFLPGTIILIDIEITCQGDGCTTQSVEHFEFVVPEETTSECGAVSDITIQYSPTGGGRIVSWDGPDNGNGLYNIEIVGSDGTTQTEHSWYSNSLITSEALPNSCDTVRIQALCGCSLPYTTGPWTETVICPPCEAPIEIHPDFICSDFAVLEFTGPFNGLGYRVRFWPADDPTDVTTLPDDIDPFFTVFALDQLTPNTTYVVEVVTLCDHEMSDRLLYTFTTDPKECVVPSNLSYEILSPGVIRLDWDAIPGANSYEVRYRLSGTSTWTTVEVLSNHFEITGLATDGCTVYEMQVRTICHPECGPGESDFSPLFNFPECLPEDLHIGMEAGQGCDPCVNKCYVCIVDGQGTKLSTLASAGGYWYRVAWFVPSSYGTPSAQLADRECIDMGPSNSGQTFYATIQKMCRVGNEEVVACTINLTYTHDCSRPGGGGEGGGGHIGGHLAGKPGTTTDNAGAPDPAFSVYPNPGTKDLYLVNKSESEYIGVVLDAYGRTLTTVQAGAGSTSRLATAEWPAGVYYIRMKMPDGTQAETLKWVKL